MPFRKISSDVKLAAICLYLNGNFPLGTILDCCGFSQRTFRRILKLYEETGWVTKPPTVLQGRRRTLVKKDVEYLLRLVQFRPDFFLDELLELLETNLFISVHYTTIHNELKRCGVSLKKLRKIAKERDETARALFTMQVAAYAPEQFGFMDEVSKDERTCWRRNGRAKKGEQASQKGVFVRGRRLSAEGLLTLDGMVASKVVEGSMTRELFLEFLEETVVSFGTTLHLRGLMTIRCQCAHHFRAP